MDTTSTLAEPAAGINWDTSPLVRAERLIRAKLYRQLFNSLLATCQRTHPSLTASELTVQYLKDRGAKAFRIAHEGFTACSSQRPNTTRSLLHAAVLLYQYSPATLDALEAGAVSILATETLLKHLRAFPEQHRHTVARDLLELAQQNQPEADFLAQAQKIRDQQHPEPLGIRAKKAAARRFVSVTEAPDSMCHIRAYLPANIGHKLQNKLNALTRSARRREPAQGRTPAQLKADIFADVLEQGTPATRGGYGTQTVLVLSLEEVIALGGVVPQEFHPALENIKPGLRAQAKRNKEFPNRPWLSNSNLAITPHGSSQPISATEAAQLLDATSHWWKIVTEPITGYPLGMGRRSYKPNEQQRLLAGLRDQRCRIPGCRVRAQDCDLDHVLAWIRGGRTDYNNLVFLCRNHHQHKTNGWIHIQTMPEKGDGVLKITNIADGRSYISHPAWPLADLAWKQHL